MNNPTYDEAAKTATFPSRSIGNIRCPACNRPQKSNRKSCYSCGCKFVFEDEQDSTKTETTVS